jgi:hypothetical protein
LFIDSVNLRDDSVGRSVGLSSAYMSSACEPLSFGGTEEAGLHRAVLLD